MAGLAAGLAETGAEATVLAADIGAREQVAGLLARIAADGPELTAVIHAAGLPEATLIEETDLAAVAGVMAAKVGGALWLDELTADHKLSAFVVFSSISATWGSGRQPGYAAGNAFLDALVERRRPAAWPGPRWPGGRGTAAAWPTARARQRPCSRGDFGSSTAIWASPRWPRWWTAVAGSSPSRTSTGSGSARCSPCAGPARCWPTCPRSVPSHSNGVRRRTTPPKRGRTRWPSSCPAAHGPNRTGSW
ncbi:SDR family NAD(P)-dependent oxidoreductase [Streptacidiphilus sp. 4-A2]|nr:SDR family NAD(P)-dependent oxidoreductase [Streptacidiphilus sp. 4-A2]